MDNKKFWGRADLFVYAITVDGYPDMKSRAPFWAQKLPFPGVKDGSTLPIDADNGWLVYRGAPKDFLNLYLLVVKDNEATRQFAEVLKENMVAKNIGTIAGAAISVFSGLPGAVTAPMVRDLTTTVVDTTLDYFSKKKDTAIGTYYASLVPEKEYGKGLNPDDYPADWLSCGDALDLAYEVTVTS